MFARLFNRLSRNRGPDHIRSMGDAVMRLLEEHGLLTVDRKLLHTLRTSRKEFFRVVYGLVMRESMYMMADIDGKVILMTNAEFTRFMMRRSATRETEIRLRDAASAAKNDSVRTVAEDAGRAVLPELVAMAAAPDQTDGVFCSDTESTLFTGATLGGAPMDGVIAIAPEVSETYETGEAGYDDTFPGHLTQGEAEPPGAEWLRLDPASLKKGENLPEGRQSLPGRKREARRLAGAASGKAE